MIDNWVFPIALLLLFFWGMHAITGNISRCEKAGGIWLMRESMCVKGLTRLEP